MKTKKKYHLKNGVKKNLLLLFTVLANITILLLGLNSNPLINGGMIIIILGKQLLEIAVIEDN